MTTKIHTLSALTIALLAGCAPSTGTPNTPAQSQSAGQALAAIATIPVGKAPHGAAFSQGFVYIGNTGSGNISVIDTTTDKKVTDITIGGVPSYTTTTPDGKFAVNVDTTGKLRIIDPSSQHAVIQTIDVGSAPDHIHFTEDGKQLLATLSAGNVLPVFTFGTDYKTAPQRRDLTIGNHASEHRNLAVHDGFALTPNLTDNTVSLVDLASGSARAITAGNSPSVVALADAGNGLTAIIGNAASNTISFTNTTGGDVTTIPGGTSPTDVVVREDGKVAFITNAGSNDLSVVDVATRKELGRVAVGKRPVHVFQAPVVTPMSVKHDEGEDTGGFIMVMNDDGDSVTVIDPATFLVKATVAVGKGHHKCAFSATKAYVTNITSSDVSVIDLTAIK